MYYVDSAVPERIHAFNPDMKIIFNVRDPEELLLSMASFAARRGIEIEVVVVRIPARVLIEGTREHEDGHHGLLPGRGTV